MKIFSYYLIYCICLEKKTIPILKKKFILKDKIKKNKKELKKLKELKKTYIKRRNWKNKTEDKKRGHKTFTI